MKTVEVTCRAWSPMDNLSYGAYFEAAEKRNSKGEVQTYCKVCELCRWPEEQALCPLFVRSEELEAFYANEAAKQDVTP